MFEDLIPSAPAPTPAPPPGMFDDLIPASGASGGLGGAMFAGPGRTDGLASPRSTAGTDPGDERIDASGRNGQTAAPLSGQVSGRTGASLSSGLFDDLIPAAKTADAASGMFDDLIPAEAPSGFAAAITDIPREIGATTGQAWENLRRALSSSLGGERDMASEGTLESLGRTGQGLLAAAALPFAPLQGVARSLVGHLMVEADQALRRGAVDLYGEDKVREAELAAGQTPGGMTYDEARRRADLVPHLIPPQGGTAVLRPALQTNPPGFGPKPGPRGFPPPPTQAAQGAETAPPEDGARSLPPLHRNTAVTGEGPHGPILDGYQGRWAEAVDWLRRAQTGDALGVLAHPDVPAPIDVIWGTRNYGLAHIIAKHPNVVDDLPARLAGMHKISESENRIRLSDGTTLAVISQNWLGERKTWLLTAFEPDPRRGGESMESPSDLPGPTRSSGPPGNGM